MRDSYRIDISSLKSMYNDFNIEKNDFKNKIGALSSNYLFSCPDSLIKRMATNLNSKYEKVGTGYTNIDNWWKEYNDEFDKLESSFRAGSNLVSVPEVANKLSGLIEKVNKSPKEMNQIDFKNQQNILPTKGSNGGEKLSFDFIKDITGSFSDGLYEKIMSTYGEDYVIQYQSDLNLVETCDIELEYLKKEREKVHAKYLQESTELNSYFDPSVATELNISKDDIKLKQQEVNELKKQLDQLDSTILDIEYYRKEIQKEIDLMPYYYYLDTEEFENYSKNFNLEEIHLRNSQVESYDYNEKFNPIAEAEYNLQYTGEGSPIQWNPGTIIVNGEEIDPYVIANFATEDNKMLYNYLFDTQGKEVADKYLSCILEDVNKNKGLYDAMKFVENLDVSDEGKLKSSLANVFDCSVEGLGDGISTYYEGLENIFNDSTIMTAEEYKRIFIIQYLSDNKLLDTSYKVGNSVGNMAPTIVLSAATSLVLTPLAPEFASSALAAKWVEGVSTKVAAGSIFLSSYGNSRSSALKQGYSHSKACFYGLASGFSEAALEHLLGGIRGVSKVKKSFINSVISEMGEEALQSAIDPLIFRSVILGEEINLDNVADDALESVLISALTAGVLNGSSSVINLSIDGVKYAVSTEEFQSIVHDMVTNNAGMVDLSTLNDVRNKIKDKIKNHGKKKENKTETTSIEGAKFTEAEIEQKMNRYTELWNIINSNPDYKLKMEQIKAGHAVDFSSSPELIKIRQELYSLELALKNYQEFGAKSNKFDVNKKLDEIHSKKLTEDEKNWYKIHDMIGMEHGGGKGYEKDCLDYVNGKISEETYSDLYKLYEMNKDDYIIGIHRSALVPKYNNSIYEEGLMMRSNSLDDNVQRMDNFAFMLEQIAVSEEYKGSNGCYIVKIPRSAVKGETPIYYEKDGKNYLNPEYIVGYAYADRNTHEITSFESKDVIVNHESNIYNEP